MLVFLIGFMGSGKSTVGKKLAKKMKYDFIDLDEEIELQENRSISQIFEAHGEVYFRRLESKVLFGLLQKKCTVISCGGGTPCYFNNMKLMNDAGCTVYLKLTTEALYSRLLIAQKNRPLIKNLDSFELKLYIQNLLEKRKNVYEVAKVSIDGLNVNVNEMQRLLLISMTN
jgi:shikimate kinase